MYYYMVQFSFVSFCNVIAVLSTHSSDNRSTQESMMIMMFIMKSMIDSSKYQVMKQTMNWKIAYNTQ